MGRQEIDVISEDIFDRCVSREIMLAKHAEMAKEGGFVLFDSCPPYKMLEQLLLDEIAEERVRIGLFAHMRCCEDCSESYESLQLSYAEFNGDWDAMQHSLDQAKQRLLVALGLK